MRHLINLSFLLFPVLLFSQTPEISVKPNQIGVNIESPVHQFHIEGYSSNSNTILYSRVNYVGAQDVHAVEGYSVPTIGYGVGGYFTGGYQGLRTIGYGQSNSSSFPTYGIHASATGTSSSGTRIGIHAQATGGATNLAARFGPGDVRVEDNISIGTTSSNGRFHVINTNTTFGSNATAARIESYHNGSNNTQGALISVNNSSSGSAFGTHSTVTNSVSGGAYGSYNSVTNSGTGHTYGVRGDASHSGSGNAFGVYGWVNSNVSGNAYALYGVASGPNHWASYALGNGYVSGDLRIGTTLDPYSGAYKLIVNGNILTEEVRVQNSNLWPDYVFKNDYKLMPLDELEKSIKENHHLPGIPSATIIEAEGLELGGMQVKMMEKIEELTLYIIQQQKEIDALKKNLVSNSK